MSLFHTLRARIPDRDLWALYLSTWVLATAYGLALATTPLVLIERHFEDGEIGIAASWFGAGIASFALPSGVLVRRFGARNTLAVCIVGYAISIMLFPFLPELWQIGVDRYFDGAFSVGAWISCETLLLLRASKEHRAFATSLYAIATGLGYFVGGGICWALVRVLTLGDIFLLAGCVAIIASGVVLLLIRPESSRSHSEEPAKERASLRAWLDLGWRIKTSSFATFCTGFFQSSVVIFLPAYLHYEKGIPENDTTLVTAVSAGGMLLISNLAGRSGDRRGHLFVLRILAMIGASVLLSFTWLTSFPVMLAAVFVGGGCLASIPPLSLALQGAIANPDEYERSNSIFNIFFATGLLIGPFLTGHVSETTGRASIIDVFASLWIAMIVLSLIFRKDDPFKNDRNP